MVPQTLDDDVQAASSTQLNWALQSWISWNLTRLKISTKTWWDVARSKMAAPLWVCHRALRRCNTHFLRTFSLEEHENLLITAPSQTLQTNKQKNNSATYPEGDPDELVCVFYRLLREGWECCTALEEEPRLQVYSSFIFIVNAFYLYCKRLYCKSLGCFCSCCFHWIAAQGPTSSPLSQLTKFLILMAFCLS